MTQRLDGVREANRSPGSLLRHPSFRRAVCVDALVRICAGGAISDGRPYRDSNASGLADCSRETLTVTVKLLVKSRLVRDSASSHYECAAAQFW